jgi:hypothetical protein
LLRRHRRCDCGGGGPAGERLYQGRQTVRAGGIVSAEKLGVVEENGLRRNVAEKGDVEEGAEWLVALGRALSDPIRVRMLGMMADGRGCCDFSGSGAPADEGDEGICVCEFEEAFSMGQSRRSSTT